MTPQLDDIITRAHGAAHDIALSLWTSPESGRAAGRAMQRLAQSMEGMARLEDRALSQADALRREADREHDRLPAEVTHQLYACLQRVAEDLVDATDALERMRHQWGSRPE